MNEDINVVDLVADAIHCQQSADLLDLRRKQARAAIEQLCNILEAAMNNSDFKPDGITVVSAMRFIARTPSQFLSA